LLKRSLTRSPSGLTALGFATLRQAQGRLSPVIGRGYFSQYFHYSLLATVEAIFNLGTLGRNDTSATPMSDLFRGGIP
jgi:hypothetical protein